MIRNEFMKRLGFGSFILMNPGLLSTINSQRQMKKKSAQTLPNYFEDELVDRASIIHTGEGDRLDLNGLSVTFKVTSEMSNNQLGVYEIVLPPQTIGAKLHYHRFMDETFMVNEGIITVEAGNRKESAHAGSVVYIPRFTPHGFRNDTDKTARITLIFNPAEKREGFFRGLYETLNEEPVDPDKFLKLYNKYDSFPVDEKDMIPK